MSDDPPPGQPSDAAVVTPRRSWRAPALASVQVRPASALLACTAGLPVDCYRFDGFHHCEKNACGCINKPTHC